jgi:pimeloyl-ACP methyl ester carboxylesterase
VHPGVRGAHAQAIPTARALPGSAPRGLVSSTAGGHRDGHTFTTTDGTGFRAIAHGGDDQIVPYAKSAPKTAELLRNAELKTSPGRPHGLTGDHEREFDADLLAFARA